VSLVPVLLAGGLFVLAGGGLPGTEGIESPTWADGDSDRRRDLASWMK